MSNNGSAADIVKQTRREAEHGGEAETGPVQGEILTMEEAAAVLRCSKAHLSNVLNGKVSTLPPLPHVSLGRRKLIRRIVLQRWIEQLEGAERR